MVDKACKTMKSVEPDKFRQIVDQFTDIATGVDTNVMRNEQSELALCADGVYYPIQSGHWVQKEIEYNTLVPFGGLNHLLMIEPIER